MPKLIYIHNPEQKESRDTLEQIQIDNILGPIVDVMDFMQARDVIRFRATPTLFILPTGAEVVEKNIAVTLEESFTITEIKNKIAVARVITLAAPKTTILVNEVLSITTSMKDLDGNAKPIEPVTFWLSGQVVTDPVGILDFSAAAPGTYVIKTQNADAVQGYLEVTVQ